jgi:hypothetical protein
VKTVKADGLTIPASWQLRGDSVIQQGQLDCSTDDGRTPRQAGPDR